MKLGRMTFAAIAATVAFAAGAYAGNGSNFIHLTNGADFFYLKNTAPVGLNGIWRCFPGDMLHSPTKTISAVGTVPAGTYASKLTAMHIVPTASTGLVITYPSMVLTSSDGDCRFLNGSALNYGLFSAGGSGLGLFIGGPLNGPGGVVNLLAGAAGVALPNPTPGPGFIFNLIISLDFTGVGGPSTIAVPAGESLVYWVADNPNIGPGAMQYWTGSQDEQNLCSSTSFLLSAGTTVFAFIKPFEWTIAVGTLDATNTSAITPNTLAPAGAADTNQNPVNFTNLIDQGSGSRTISVTGAGKGSESLSVAAYDEDNAFGGSNRLYFLNLMAVNIQASPSCGPWSAGYFAVATGGPGGPTLSNLIPQMPRLTGKLDNISILLIQNPVWTFATVHGEQLGALDEYWFANNPGPISGSSGNNGGVAIPIPALAQLIGVELYLFSASMNAAGTAIAKTANNGHSHGNGYPIFFHP